MGFTAAQLQEAAGRQVDDLLGPGLRLLFVGINPGLWTAAADAHFARPGNRFFPALFRCGLTDHLINPSAGMSDADRAHLIERGIGITNLVRRASARAADLTRDELTDGGERIARLVAAHRPQVVAIAGITAYRTAYRRARASAGEQEDLLAGAKLWVVPNPSGLNAHETLDSLAAAYGAVGRAAGLLPAQTP
ncbi:MAG: mismatch-specific DNA-glycosylase [Nakamurella sp.]